MSAPNQLAAFVEKYGQRNSEYGVYFGVCKREARDGTKKSIVRIPALWADVDTVKNKWDHEAVVKRIHEVPGVLRPSACISSGGGLHLYWFLDEPVTIRNELVDRGAVEHLNKLLRDIFAGDAIQNVDRILRVPGTWNTKRRPAKKVEVLWNYHFNRVGFVALATAAETAKQVIGDDGEWISAKEQHKRDMKTVLLADPLDRYAAMYGKGSRSRHFKEMWQNRVRYHAPRGYMGIHEAALIHSACLFNDRMPEDKIVETVLRHMQIVKDRDAADEAWDMGKEAEAVRGMIASWRPKQAAYEKQRRAEAAGAKKNGRAITVRHSSR